MEQKKLTEFKIVNLYKIFLGFLIKEGKKTSAKRLVEKALFSTLIKTKKSKNIIFLRLFLKLNTFIETKKIKIRKRIYIVPFSLSLKRRSYLVIKWLLQTVKENKESVSLSLKLSKEIVEVLINSKAKALTLKKLNNNQAFLNRSNYHYRW